MMNIFEPFLMGNEKKYVSKCLETGWISSQGEFITKFEDFFACYHGVKHAVATSNCTTALHLSLKAFGIGPGDEVICPDLTFIAPANMIVLSGANLVLVDIDPETLAIDPVKLERIITERTKAIIVVHQFGHAAPMDEILAIAAKFNLKIIEDNAESIGGKYKGKLLGTLGDISCFSFFANKIITSGEGGMILSDNDEVAEKCRILRDHGMSRTTKYLYVDLGYNYRMTNMQAAVGLAQLENIDAILEKRNRQLDFYNQLFEGVVGVTTRKFKDWCTPVHWMMTITLDEKYNRNEFLEFMKQQGIDCRQMINPVHTAEHFKHIYDDKQYPHSKHISAQSAHLPCSTCLKESELEFIVEKVKEFVL